MSNRVVGKVPNFQTKSKDTLLKENTSSKSENDPVKYLISILKVFGLKWA
jgi:hypothetical protein